MPFLPVFLYPATPRPPDSFSGYPADASKYTVKSVSGYPGYPKYPLYIRERDNISYGVGFLPTEHMCPRGVSG